MFFFIIIWNFFLVQSFVLSILASYGEKLAIVLTENRVKNIVLYKLYPEQLWTNGFQLLVLFVISICLFRSCQYYFSFVYYSPHTFLYFLKILNWFHSTFCWCDFYLKHQTNKLLLSQTFVVLLFSIKNYW